MITGRLATKSDLKRIAEIKNAIFPNSTSEEYFLSLLQIPNSYLVVAEDNGQIVGFSYMDNTREITYFMIDPSLGSLKKISVAKEMAKTFVRETVTIGQKNTTRFRILPGSHQIVRNAIISWMGFQKTDVDQNGNEIWEGDFPDKSLAG